jgi:hypothetical protein
MKQQIYIEYISDEKQKQFVSLLVHEAANRPPVQNGIKDDKSRNPAGLNFYS